MTSRFLVVTTLTASLAALPMLASADTGGPTPAKTHPSVVTDMLAQAGGSSGAAGTGTSSPGTSAPGAAAGTSATTGTGSVGSPSTTSGSMGSSTGSAASSGSTGAVPYRRTMPDEAQMPNSGQMPGHQMQDHQMQGQMGNFNPHNYRSTTDCLNAAAAAGMALSACGNTHGR